MTVSKLSLYNGALRLCRERKLGSLSENREPRRLLDDAWGDGGITDGAVRHCLQLGQWSFATRTAEVAYSTSIDPSFGYRYAFDQPNDMVRVIGLCQDEYFKVPLLDYNDEGGYWYAPIATIYVRYVSNRADYGLSFARWPESFTKLVEAYLANEIVGNLTQSSSSIKDDIAKQLRSELTAARSMDAMNQPTRMLPQGSWVSARGGVNRHSRWSGR